METYRAHEYIEGILSGSIVAGTWVKAAVRRHVNDLSRIGTVGFPFTFDERLAGRAIDFVQQLSHTKGQWASRMSHSDIRIRLEPWQQFIIWVTQGWRKLDGTRRFTHVYIEVARKNGKTTMAAGLANFHFFADRPKEIGPEIYFAATKQEQATIAWNEMRMQAEGHPKLRKMIKVYNSKQHITIPGTAARVRPLGRDSKTEDGLNPHCIVVDEYHAHPDASLLEVLESGMGSRAQPITYIITTAGFDLRVPCFRVEHESAQRMLSGIMPWIEHQWAIIYTLDEDDDWTDPAVWIKANPNLGVSVSEDYLTNRVEQALAIPERQNDIKTKNFNVWVQSATLWLTDVQWMKCASPYDLEALKGRECYVGMDLSTNTDTTAVVYVFPPTPADPRWIIHPRFYIPEDDMIERERRDQVPYSFYVEQGLIVATPGNVVDLDYIEQDILAQGENFLIKEIAYDKWRANQLVSHLQTAGFEMVAISQTYSGMAAYTAAFELAVLSEQITHGGNDVLRWQMACVELKKDRQGNFMPMKPRGDSYGKRIDGIVATIMGFGRAMSVVGGGPSIYEEQGIRGI